jgi:hypothetical protein
MDKVTRWLLGALLAVVAVLGAYAAVDYVVTLRTALVQATADAKTAKDALKKTQATLALREAKRVAAEASARSARDSLAAVLLKNNTWATAPVPQEVQDDLCKTLRCAPGDSADSVRDTSDDRP